VTLEKVQAETRRRTRAPDFSERQQNGNDELVIELKEGGWPRTPITRRYTRATSSTCSFPDFQRYLYDCMHDYLVEMFTHTPQSRELRP
jgi:hypothetical protein